MRRLRGLVLVFLILQSGRSYAGWPFNRTPAIEGVVTDATTGEPVENVVVSCVWLKGMPSPGGDVTTGFAGELSITGKDGRYKIPGKVSFHLLSHFNEVRLQIIHPLYESKMAWWFPEDWEHLFKGETSYKLLGTIRKLEGEYRDGVIHYDIGLMGLRERYLKEVTSGKSQVTSEEEKKRRIEMGLSFESYLRTHENGWYWLTLKDKNVVFDLAETFDIWEKIASNFDKYSDSNYRTRDVKETEEKIRKKLEGVRR